MKRERLGSRLGFIMLSAGCAIGCGNVWKFPWMCGQNGGGSFMLVYILCLIILGIPCLIMEFLLVEPPRQVLLICIKTGKAISKSGVALDWVVL